MVVGFCWFLLFLFVPETFWDRTPRPKARPPSRNASRLSIFRNRKESHTPHPFPTASGANQADAEENTDQSDLTSPARPSDIRSPSSFHRPTHGLHVGFAQDESQSNAMSSDASGNVDDTHLSPREAGPTSPAAASHMSEIQLSSNVTIQ
jgi:hypothetical protein